MIVALSAGRDSPAELRARLALDEQGQRALLAGPRPGVAELVVVSTCHRTEIYATGDGLDADVVHAVAALMPGLLPTDQHDVRFMQGAEAIEHLFRVAGGLDSLVIGEPQVLGQVRRALVLAERAGATGPVLSNIFGRALRVGRRVRSDTALGKLGASIGAIAADYLVHRFDGIAGRKAAVIGAGEAAGDAAQFLRKAGAEISVISRTLSSAEALAEQVDAGAYQMESLKMVLAKSDFALVAVSGGFMLETSVIPERTADEPFVVLDLSVPPAVQAGSRDDLDVRTLEEIPGPRGPEIADAVIDAEAIVKKEVADLQHWADTRAVAPTIKDLQVYADSLVQTEVMKTVSGWDLSEEQKARLDGLGTRIAKKLLHGPTTELRRADEQTRAIIRRMFNLSE